MLEKLVPDLPADYELDDDIADSVMDLLVDLPIRTLSTQEIKKLMAATELTFISAHSHGVDVPREMFYTMLANAVVMLVSVHAKLISRKNFYQMTHAEYLAILDLGKALYFSKIQNGHSTPLRDAIREVFECEWKYVSRVYRYLRLSEEDAKEWEDVLGQDKVSDIRMYVVNTIWVK